MNPKDRPVIMIADDSRVVRVSLKNILKNDCQLIEAEDGQQAWEQLLENPEIRLIFSDLSMPRLDGRGLLSKIRNSEITRIRNIPFIVVTGNELESSIRDELQDMGATEVVSKPFDPASIVSFITTLSSRQESESYMLLPDEQAQSEFLPDALTQSDFMLSASRELSFAIRNKNELAVALLRIDQFEQLSTHYSDPAIEHILLTTAEVVRQHIHPDDTMAYFGDGLFAILRPASNAIGSRYIGRRIIDDLAAKQFYLGESDELVSVSIGISAPQIKPGIRLKELLLLAEGRLKAAMDLGGGRVIDKGNDTLTPVGLGSDSGPGLSRETGFSSVLHSDGIKSSHLRIDSDSDRTGMQNSVDTQELESRIEQLQSRVESLAHENTDLQGQIERWRKQSGESEQLRRRVFELESEQQQMQVKLNDLGEENRTLRKHADTAEEARRKLLDESDEKSVTLQQANQFYEQENVRLEGQLEALSNRAQKAELANRKSEQLVISLKDNIKLLRAQMEQIKQQLVATQKQSQSRATPESPEPEPALDEDTHLVSQNDAYQEALTDSDLAFNGFPSGLGSLPDEKAGESASVVQLFSEPSQLPEGTDPTNKPAAPVNPATAATPSRAVKPATQEKADLSVPVYRAKPKEAKFREPRNLSSFAIASIILLLLLALGGGYLYFYWEKDVDQAKLKASDQPASTSETAVMEKSTTSSRENPAATLVEPASAASKPAAAAQRPAPVTSTQKATQATSASMADEEARLQAELTLRQIAEEEFQQRLQQVTPDETDTVATAKGDSPGFSDVETDTPPNPLEASPVEQTATPEASQPPATSAIESKPDDSVPQ